MITATLTRSEFTAAAHVGLLRQAGALANARADRTQPDRTWLDGLVAHVIGACGEAAAHKARGRWWDLSLDGIGRADYGADIQIRTRRNRDHDLIVHDYDPEHWRYVLVVGEPPTMDVIGWISGADARQDHWRANHGGYRPAWFVPQSALTSFE